MGNKILRALSLLVLLMGISWPASAQDPPRIFVDAQVPAGAIPAQPSEHYQRTVTRERWVDIDFSLLPNPTGAEPGASAAGDQTTRVGSAEPPGLLELNLFDDRVYTLEIDEIRDESPDGTTISVIGHLLEVPAAQAILTSSGSILSGNIVIPGTGYFQVRYAGYGHHVVREIDQSGYPPEKKPREPAIAESNASPSGQPLDEPDNAAQDGSTNLAEQDPSGDESGSVIDVMVVYTPAARSAAGGTTAMNNLIDLAVTETNTGYANSGLVQRIHLVHREQVSYTEATSTNPDPFDVALDDLTGTSDGKMDNAHTLRDDYNADLVSLFIDDHTWCGLAHVMTSESHGFENLAFSVVDWDCATGNYSFAHEMAHNQGGRHDRPHDNSDGVFSYSHGYQDPDEDFRTILSYDCPGGCTRVNYWSNPDLEYVDGGGTKRGPMGIAYDQTNSADMRRSHNLTRDTAANWRPRFVYVDQNWSGTETGLSSHPFDTISEGVNRIGKHATGARLYIKPDYYSGSGNFPLTISRPMTVYPWGTGTVTIGP